MAPKLPLVPNDFKLTTWLATGAAIQAIMMMALPSRFAITLPFMVILSKMIMVYLEVQGFRRSPSTVKRGRWTTRIPLKVSANVQDRSQGGFVLFILGARTLQ